MTRVEIVSGNQRLFLIGSMSHRLRKRGEKENEDTRSFDKYILHTDLFQQARVSEYPFLRKNGTISATKHRYENESSDMLHE